jgi:hypothetical protein
MLVFVEVSSDDIPWLIIHYELAHLSNGKSINLFWITKILDAFFFLKN